MSPGPHEAHEVQRENKRAWRKVGIQIFLGTGSFTQGMMFLLLGEKSIVSIPEQPSSPCIHRV